MIHSTPFPLFNEAWYLAQNPDVAATVTAGLLTGQDHFRQYGNAEDRSPGPLFDTQWYLEQNPDVAAAVAQGLMSAYDHFVQFGASENRPPFSLFDPQFYLAHSPDVAAAVAAGAFTAVEHFLMFGHAEARIISPFINLGAYARANPDLAAAVTGAGGHFDLMSHLLQFGVAEGRDLGNGVNLEIFANDPAFQSAVGSGNTHAALERAGDVAPFLPGFVPVPGWSAPPDTPIPLDFIPPAGTRLVIPPGVIVPPDVELPDTFEPVTPPPKPIPTPDDGPPLTFTVDVNNGVRTFGGTAAGDITAHIDADNIVSFTRSGITVHTDIDLDSWVSGYDYLHLKTNEILQLNPTQALFFSALAGCGCDTHFAIVGTGTVRIDTSELNENVVPDLLDPSGPPILDLNGISPTVAMSFNGSTAVNLDDGVILSLRPEHANGISIAGDGTVYIGGNGDAAAGAVLDISTAAGLGNFIMATNHADEITAWGMSENTIVGGLSGDTVVLGDDTLQNMLWVMGGTADIYAAFAAFLDAAGFEQLPAGSEMSVELDGETFTASWSGTEWSEFQGDDRDAILPYQFTIDNDDNTLTVLGDTKFDIKNAKITTGVTEYTGTLSSVDPTGEGLFPSDSSPDDMDVIHGFDVGRDVLLLNDHHFGGRVVHQLDDQDTTLGVLDFHIQDGIATVVSGTLPADPVPYVLEQLSGLMGSQRHIVVYDDGTDSYLFYGDGEIGLQDSDMVVKLAEVTGVTDISCLVVFGLGI